MMPYSDTFALSKIIVEFILADGSSSILETKVVEREAAKVMYTEALKKGETAVTSYTQSPHESKKMLRIMLGNFPPHSKAYLQAICT